MWSHGMHVPAVAAAVAIAAFGGAAWAGPTGHRTVTEPQARAIALRQAGGGTIRTEGKTAVAGDPAYTFDIAVAHKANMERVVVSETTGKVLGSTYAGPQAKSS